MGYFTVMEARYSCSIYLFACPYSTNLEAIKKELVDKKENILRQASRVRILGELQITK